MPRALPPPPASGLGSFLPPQQPAASASVQQSARQTGQESTASCTLPLPESPSGLKAKNFFVSWHANGYYVQPHDAYAKYTPGSKERKRVKSAVSRMRSVVEFFTLFLTEHVAPLPSTPLGSPSYTAWRKKLEDQADAAWCRFVRFWQEKKRVQRALPSEALSPVLEKQFNVAVNDWMLGRTRHKALKESSWKLGKVVDTDRCKNRSLAVRFQRDSCKLRDRHQSKGHHFRAGPLRDTSPPCTCRYFRCESTK